MTLRDFDKIKAPKIKVIGVGGCGKNAVNNMIENQIEGVDFILINTDYSTLKDSKVKTIQIGESLTKGLGSGGNPEIGRKAALENAEEIKSAITGSQMLFIAAGLGGGTGTGAAPVVAEIAQREEILTVSVVTKPFDFEGLKRLKIAEEGLASLRNHTDTFIIILNDHMKMMSEPEARVIDIFKLADSVLYHSVKGITDLIMVTGHVNVDFADVQATMVRGGMGSMGVGSASGDKRAIKAITLALEHPLLEKVSIAHAQNILMNIAASKEMTLDEVGQASDLLQKTAGEQTNIIWGAVFDESLQDRMKITLIVTRGE